MEERKASENTEGRGNDMSMDEFEWASKPNDNKEICYRKSDGKILGEVTTHVTTWADVNGQSIGNYVSVDYAKKAVEFALTGENK